MSRNIASMIGLSVYVLADTYFISVSDGADGITVLNLALPLYGLIFAMGSMIGIGSATVYAIKRAQWEISGRESGRDAINGYFLHSLAWQLIVSLPLMVLGFVNPRAWLTLMGGDSMISAMGRNYVQIVLIGTPFFMFNYTFSSFARNDNAPTIAMISALGGSIFNIIFDYIFIFPCGMGMTGAALATAMAPAVSTLICLAHYFSRNCTIKPVWMKPSVREFARCCQLGVSAFVSEMSSAVTTVVFNTLLLSIAGNVAVAAYGIIANLALVALALFNGISQGTQPLFSKYYGAGDKQSTNYILKLALMVAGGLQLALIACSWLFTDKLVAIFNSEGNAVLSVYAHDALRLYFLGYIFAGVNIVLVSYFAAIGKGAAASIASILRGAAAIIGCAVALAAFFGIRGVWLSFLAAEMITFCVIIVLVRRMAEPNVRFGN